MNLLRGLIVYSVHFLPGLTSYLFLEETTNFPRPFWQFA